MGNSSGSNSIPWMDQHDTDEKDDWGRRLLADEAEQEVKFQGDGFGITFYYLVFVIGTVISSYIVFNLKDKDVFDLLRKQEFEERKNKLAIELTLLQETNHQDHSKKKKQFDAMNEKDDEIIEGPSICQTLVSLWRIQRSNHVYRLTPFMFSLGYLEGILQTFAYKYMREPLLVEQPDVPLADLNMQISLGFMVSGLAGVISGMMMSDIFKKLEVNRIYSILLRIQLGTTFLVFILGYGLTHVGHHLGYYLSFAVSCSDLTPQVFMCLGVTTNLYSSCISTAISKDLSDEDSVFGYTIFKQWQYWITGFVSIMSGFFCKKL